MKDILKEKNEYDNTKTNEKLYDLIKEAENEMNSTIKRYSKEDVVDCINNLLKE